MKNWVKISQKQYFCSCCEMSNCKLWFVIVNEFHTQILCTVCAHVQQLGNAIGIHECIKQDTYKERSDKIGKAKPAIPLNYLDFKEEIKLYRKPAEAPEDNFNWWINLPTLYKIEDFLMSRKDQSGHSFRYYSLCFWDHFIIKNPSKENNEVRSRALIEMFKNQDFILGKTEKNKVSLAKLMIEQKVKFDKTSEDEILEFIDTLLRSFWKKTNLRKTYSINIAEARERADEDFKHQQFMGMAKGILGKKLV